MLKIIVYVLLLEEKNLTKQIKASRLKHNDQIQKLSSISQFVFILVVRYYLLKNHLFEILDEKTVRQESIA